ncbi:hypothetical protein MnTg04_00858 [bacterium MnTg04]|nr:hypothetical protein MnTg04_00858 [bacterium MnTg04]
MDQYPGLAAAGAGQYQHRVLPGGHRLTLGFVQGVEYGGNIHRREL